MFSHFFKKFFKQKPKVMFVVPGEIPWTDECKASLNQFMGSAVGKAFMSQLKNDLYFSQAKACMPDSKVTAAERCAIAHGKQLLIASIMSLYTFDYKQPEYMMSDAEIDQVLNERINGRTKKDFVL